MSNQYSQRGSTLGAEDRYDPARTADGQTGRRVANISGEPSIDRAREAFERADLGGARGGSYREPSYGRRSDGKGTKSEITGGPRQQKFAGVGSGAASSTGLMLLCGVGIGAALMYLLDPDQGGRRCALLRDKLAGATNKAGDLFGKTPRDLGDRARGVISEPGSTLSAGGNVGRSQSNESQVEATRNTETRSHTPGQGS